ncbi:MAG: hydrogenase formation protein HypD, partial [Bacteroidetes bacterium]|nr:hydrogenase formation protein HypD [Bacteroidota bacterium]
MRFIDEYRDAAAARKTSRQIHRITSRPWTIMEICGGQTHTIVKYGLESLLPDTITLVHGPGCPVCVTPLELIDKAIAIALRPDVIFTSFGDMLRVPGSTKNLLSVKAERGNVRIVYSPLDALRVARENPDKKVVF